MRAVAAKHAMEAPRFKRHANELQTNTLGLNFKTNQNDSKCIELREINEITILWSRVFATHRYTKDIAPWSSGLAWALEIFSGFSRQCLQSICWTAAVLKNLYQARHYFIFPCDKCPFGLEPLRLGDFRQSNTETQWGFQASSYPDVSSRMYHCDSLCKTWCMWLCVELCYF